MRVYNLINKQGNAVKNQIVIVDGNKTTFQSYDAEIVKIDNDNMTITFYPAYNFSVTTAKHRDGFLSQILDCNITSADVNRMISTGKWNGYNVNME